MKNFKIVVVVPTKNEEKNIHQTLISIKSFADQIIVVDSNSTDQTSQISKNLGAEVVSYNQKGVWPKKRQITFNSIMEEHADNKQILWFVNIDADERFSKEAKIELINTIEKNNCDVIFGTYSMEFLGRKLKYCYAGNRKIVALKAGHAEYKDLGKSNEKIDYEIHEPLTPLPNARGYHIKSQLIHLNEEPLNKFISKHNNYSDWEAESTTFLKGNNMNSLQFRMKVLLYKSKFYPLIMFFYFYFLRFGFLDGFPGFTYSIICYLWQPAMVQAKRLEKRIGAK
jgi:glycosyltransferase involved in cell wall biosynthesis